MSESENTLIFENKFIYGLKYCIVCPHCGYKQIYKPNKRQYTILKRYHTCCKNPNCSRHFNIIKPLMVIKPLSKSERRIISLFYTEFDHAFTRRELMERLNIHKSGLSRAIKHLIELKLIKEKVYFGDEKDINQRDVRYIRDFTERWDYYTDLISLNEVGCNILGNLYN